MPNVIIYIEISLSTIFRAEIPSVRSFFSMKIINRYRHCLRTLGHCFWLNLEADCSLLSIFDAKMWANYQNIHSDCLFSVSRIQWPSLCYCIIIRNVSSITDNKHTQRDKERKYKWNVSLLNECGRLWFDFMKRKMIRICQPVVAIKLKGKVNNNSNEHQNIHYMYESHTHMHRLISFGRIRPTKQTEWQLNVGWLCWYDASSFWW